jgi:HSP20 family protein
MMPAVDDFYIDRGAVADVRLVAAWLDEVDTPGVTAAEHWPPIDVVETATAVHVVADVPGVPAESLRVIFSRGLLVLAGCKRPPAFEHDGAAFHLAERSFGRFACAVRLGDALDVGRARATLRAGELLVVLPRIEDRRGGEIRIKVETA